MIKCECTTNVSHVLFKSAPHPLPVHGLSLAIPSTILTSPLHFSGLIQFTFNVQLTMNIKYLTLFVLGHFASAQINKPLISPPMPSLDQGLLNNLTPTQSTSEKWGWGWIPKDCKTMVEGEGFSPYDVEVYNIVYTDVCPFITYRYS